MKLVSICKFSSVKKLTELILLKCGWESKFKKSLCYILQTINQGQKIEFAVKVGGPKPLTVTWYLNGTKLKSSKNRKVTYSSSQGDAKMLVMESDAEDHGEYTLEVSNQFGQVTQTCMVTVISKFLYPFALITKNHGSCIIVSSLGLFSDKLTTTYDMFALCWTPDLENP